MTKSVHLKPTALTTTVPSMMPDESTMTRTSTMMPMIMSSELELKMFDDLYASVYGDDGVPEDRCSSFSAKGRIG